MSIIEVDVDCERITLWHVNALNEVPNDRLDFEAKIGSAQGVELNQGVAQFFASCLRDGRNLIDVMSIDCALVGQVDNALLEALPR